MRMDELLRAAGVPTVEYSLKTKCCGGSLTGTTHAVGVRLNYILLKEAARKGAQAIVTVCPLCQYNLDAYQAEIRRATGEAVDMPVLYFTQILGWALGGDTGIARARARDFGTQDHRTVVPQTRGGEGSLCLTHTARFVSACTPAIAEPTSPRRWT